MSISFFTFYFPTTCVSNSSSTSHGCLLVYHLAISMFCTASVDFLYPFCFPCLCYFFPYCVLFALIALSRFHAPLPMSSFALSMFSNPTISLGFVFCFLFRAFCCCLCSMFPCSIPFSSTTPSRGHASLVVFSSTLSIFSSGFGSCLEFVSFFKKNFSFVLVFVLLAFSFLAFFLLQQPHVHLMQNKLCLVLHYLHFALVVVSYIFFLSLCFSYFCLFVPLAFSLLWEATNNVMLLFTCHILHSLCFPWFLFGNF